MSLLFDNNEVSRKIAIRLAQNYKNLQKSVLGDTYSHLYLLLKLFIKISHKNNNFSSFIKYFHLFEKQFRLKIVENLIDYDVNIFSNDKIIDFIDEINNLENKSVYHDKVLEKYSRYKKKYNK